ncbi:MAG TPA: type II CAAX endopeptidase family protein [Rhizomicrobium sp.]
MPHLNVLDLLIVAWFALVMPVQAWRAGRRLAKTPRSAIDMTARYRVIIIRNIVLSVLILCDWRWAARPWSALGFDIPIGLAGRIGFGLDSLLLAVFVWSLTRTLSADARAKVNARFETYRIVPQSRAGFRLFPVVGAIGGAFEELMCRGFLIWFFAPFVGLWGAIILSSALFGLIHVYQGWFGVLRAGAVGLAFAIAYVFTHSLWWLMLDRAVFNVHGSLLARKLWRESCVGSVGTAPPSP